MEKFNYYKSELSKIDTTLEFAPKFKITTDNITTKWMDLNSESAQILFNWLKEKYPVS